MSLFRDKTEEGAWIQFAAQTLSGEISSQNDSYIVKYDLDGCKDMADRCAKMADAMLLELRERKC